MTFWIVSSLMALAVAALIVVTLLRARNGAAPSAAYDLQVYRDQLRDVDRDLARGTIDAADADRIRTEVSRRILAADAQAQKEQTGQAQPRSASLVAGVLLGVVMIAGTFALYQRIGAPGYGDLALSHRIEMAAERRENRPAQAEAEAQMPPLPRPNVDESYKQLIEQLRATVATRPDDVQGFVLLAQHEANLGNFNAAYQAKSRVIDLLGDDVTANDFLGRAEMQIAAAGGYVSPEAETDLRAVLAREPWNVSGRYYWGLMLIQTGRPDLAFRIWEQTLRTTPPTSPRLDPIRARIEEAAWLAGVDYTLPDPAMPGPDSDDVQAAQDMNAEDRQAMIQGMVDGLSDRLATDGGSPDEWARLITALGVLGQTDRAAAIYQEAQQAFGDNPQALDLIRNAGEQAGVAE